MLKDAKRGKSNSLLDRGRMCDFVKWLLGAKTFKVGFLLRRWVELFSLAEFIQLFYQGLLGQQTLMHPGWGELGNCWALMVLSTDLEPACAWRNTSQILFPLSSITLLVGNWGAERDLHKVYSSLAHARRPLSVTLQAILQGQQHFYPLKCLLHCLEVKAEHLASAWTIDAPPTSASGQIILSLWASVQSLTL